MKLTKKNFDESYFQFVVVPANKFKIWKGFIFISENTIELTMRFWLP